MTNTLAIAVIHALESIPRLNRCAANRKIFFPCNTVYDFDFLVEMCDYRLEDIGRKHTKTAGKKETTYTFPNGGVIHLFVKEG